MIGECSFRYYEGCDCKKYFYLTDWYPQREECLLGSRHERGVFLLFTGFPWVSCCAICAGLSYLYAYMQCFRYILVASSFLILVAQRDDSYTILQP